jgi:glycosyltransferase involved in cell wall biosynthesis
MKKVLLISYYFSDLTVIGSVRINALVKYLPQLGWQPNVIAGHHNSGVESGNGEKNETNYDSYTKWKKMLRMDSRKGFKEQLNLDGKNMNNAIDLALKIHDEIINYPDAVSLWLKPAIRRAEALLEEERFDAILSSSAPPTNHLIARELKKHHGIPWIADFRDLWTQNHYYRHSRIRRHFEEQLEINTISLADTLVTVSKPLANKLMMLHRGKKTYVVTNGYDPHQVNPGRPLPNKFTISYTGSIYKGRQDPELLLAAIADLISSRSINPSDISLEFYGNIEKWLLQEICRYDLENVAKVFGPISRQESIEKQRCSHLLLLLAWNDPQEPGIYSGKLFDYLAARRPILSIGITGGVVDALLRETQAGTHISKLDELKCFLLESYIRYKYDVPLQYNGIDSEIEKYSHLQMAKKFSDILNETERNGI